MTRRLVAAGLACATFVLGSCASGPQSRTSAYLPARLGGSISLTDCRDWNDTDARDRYQVIGALESFYGGPISSGQGSAARTAPGPVIAPDDAYALFERACKPSYAAAFKLYKLYGRAAAFTGSPAQPAP
ncbi:MAG: hypothetical protein QOG62_1007 [Thermoleophilaceae bacterium]|nr:hypothetical protein [Thermoleophilaceae bacterium]